MIIKKVEDLNIYKIALSLNKEVDELVKGISLYWENKDVSQAIRSAPSVPSNISEGFAQRFYPKQFIRYLNIALGSSDETKNHLHILMNNGHINSEKGCYYYKRYKNLSVRIINFISYLRMRHNIK